MSREGVLAILVGVALVCLLLLALSWARRRRRDAGLHAPVGELPEDARILATFAGLYVATTRHGQPLERCTAGIGEIQAIDHLGHLVSGGAVNGPRSRDPLDPIVRARQLTVDRSGRIRILPEVDRQQRAVGEGRALRERP